MAETVNVNKIIVTRTLGAEDDDYSKLAEHIQAHGIKIPILVSRQFIILDGLRRLEAAKSVDIQTVPIVIATDFLAVHKELLAARKHGIQARFSWQRVWEVFRDTRGLVADELAISRRIPLKERKNFDSRGLLVDAFGLKTVAQLQAISHVYRMAEQDTTPMGDQAREAAKLLTAGEISPYTAESMMRRSPELTGDIVNVSEQRALLRSITDTLSGVSKGFTKLGELDPSITSAELTSLLASLKVSRRQVGRIVRLLEERASTHE